MEVIRDGQRVDVSEEPWRRQGKPEVMEIPPITLVDIVRHPLDFLIASGAAILIALCATESLVNRSKIVR